MDRGLSQLRPGAAPRLSRAAATIAALGVVLALACIRAQPGRVGADGGAVSSADGRATVVIPAGALQGEVDVTVRPAAGAPPGALAAYEFGPSGTTFAVPAELALRVDPAAIASGAVALAVAEGGTWVPLPVVGVDLGGGTVVGRTRHFSVFGIVPLPPEAPGASPCFCGAGSCTAQACAVADGSLLACTDQRSVCRGTNLAFDYVYWGAFEQCSSRKIACTECYRGCMGPPVRFDMPLWTICRYAVPDLSVLPGVGFPDPAARIAEIESCILECDRQGFGSPGTSPCGAFVSPAGRWGGPYTMSGTVFDTQIAGTGVVAATLFEADSVVTGTFTSSGTHGSAVGSIVGVFDPLEPALLGQASGSTGGCRWSGSFDTVYFTPLPVDTMHVQVFMTLQPPCVGQERLFAILERDAARPGGP